MYNSWNKIYKSKIIKENNITFPDIPFGEDNSFNLKYIPYCKTIYNIQDCLYHYVREIKNSITMKYIPNFFDIRISENKSFTKLFKNFNINKIEYTEFITKRFIERTIGCLENLHRKNNLTIKEKIKETKKIIHHKETKKYLKLYKTKNKKLKIILKTYKIKNPLPAYIIGYALNRFKKYFPNIFNRKKNKR